MSNRLAPLFLSATLLLGGCASTRHFESVVPAAPDNGCWSTTERVAKKKGDEGKEEVVGREITSRVYDKGCGDRQVLTARNNADASIERARIDAASGVLVAGLAAIKDPALLNDAYKRIVERLDNPATRESQLDALKKVNKTEEFVRSQIVKCRMVEQKVDGTTTMIFECN